MPTILTIDGAGRLVLPKPVRDRYGLEPGSEIELTDDGKQIGLRPIAGASPLRDVGGYLVYTGRFRGSPTDTVREDREARLRRVAGR